MSEKATKCGICHKKLKSYGHTLYLNDGNAIDRKCAKDVGLWHELGKGNIRKACKKEISLNDIKNYLSEHKVFDIRKIKKDGKEIANKQKEYEKARVQKFEDEDSTKIENLYFNDKRQILLIKSTLLTKQREVKYTDIINYQKIVHGKTTKKHHGVLRAAVGGALAGGVGAIVGATTGGKNYDVISRLAVVINFKDNTSYQVNIISQDQKIDSWIYRADQQEFLKLCSTLDKIIDSNKSKKQAQKTSSVVDPADEIRKLKGLLDDNIITQEEFDTKKKQLLKL